MQGYIFQNEQQAIKARQQAADYKGYPIRPGDTTIYWVNYNYSELDGFYYILYVDGLEAVLGQPTDITITPHEEI
jgi:Xaa-Pro aminopeptidase